MLAFCNFLIGGEEGLLFCLSCDVACVSIPSSDSAELSDDSLEREKEKNEKTKMGRRGRHMHIFFFIGLTFVFCCLLLLFGTWPVGVAHKLVYMFSGRFSESVMSSSEFSLA